MTKQQLQQNISNSQETVADTGTLFRHLAVSVLQHVH
jgi:hypothetical protein